MNGRLEGEAGRSREEHPNDFSGSVELYSGLLESAGEPRPRGNMVGCGLQSHDKRGWQVLVADKFPGLYSEGSWQEGLWNIKELCKVD